MAFDAGGQLVAGGDSFLRLDPFTGVVHARVPTYSFISSIIWESSYSGGKRSSGYSARGGGGSGGGDAGGGGGGGGGRFDSRAGAAGQAPLRSDAGLRRGRSPPPKPTNPDDRPIGGSARRTGATSPGMYSDDRPIGGSGRLAGGAKSPVMNPDDRPIGGSGRKGGRPKSLAESIRRY